MCIEHSTNTLYVIECWTVQTACRRSVIGDYHPLVISKLSHYAGQVLLRKYILKYDEQGRIIFIRKAPRVSLSEQGEYGL